MVRRFSYIRIWTEIADAQSYSNRWAKIKESYTFEIDNDEKFIITCAGPEETPYAGGIF